jgi:histidinol-phosphate aminotransferase
VDLDRLAKPFLKNITPYRPGKPIEQLQRERGITATPAKLASNENPYPPHRRIREALISAIDNVNRYPESGSPELSDKLSEILSVSRSEIIVGNGTNEIIDLLVRAYVETDENCVFSSLSFVIYKLVSMQCGVRGIEVPARGYRHDLDAMGRAINAKTKIVFICNPNNPTGTYCTADEVDAFVAGIPDHVLVVFDQAYLEYVEATDYPDTLALRKKRENIVSLRTFSKVFSLAGLRIGYAVADARVIDSLNKMRQPFNVNRLAQAAASAALDCRDDLKDYVRETVRERERMRNAMLDMGCECPASQTNFLFVTLRGFSGDICRGLEDLGVIVRPTAQFGGPANSFRVNTGTPEENDRFIAGLGKVLGKA